LEPAAQLEVSLSPQTDVKNIGAIYERFVSEITPILKQYSYEMVTYGYQPKSRVEDLELLPKPRYRFMDAYFAKIGPFGRQMMRGTAATQVSVDYYSEEDFSDKYRIAYALKDVLASFCSNSPVYEGRAYNGSALRDEIWSKTDARRVDVAPFMSYKTMSFEDYTDFVMQTPVIVNRDGTEEYYDERTIGELAKERIFSGEELSHMLSMVFPMIRAKHFLEIRFADSMPMERVLKYVLLLKGLLTDVEYTKEWLFSEEFAGLGLPEQTEYMLKKVVWPLAEEEKEYFKKE
jgi:glutamate--cysteine ligase